ncbi:MAG: translation elongation factor-like protein [Chloroflexi bacterium]|nr:translation elongation factor-like protein [Chloroflexota bacterium]
MAEQLIGTVSHFFNRIEVAAIELAGTLKVGDTIHILGRTTDFIQEVTSMQIEHRNVPEAGKGDSVGIKVIDRVRAGDKVYKISS